MSSILERVQIAIEAYPKRTNDPVELRRLQEFLERMKAAGVATIRDYDLPRIDTIGRTNLSRPIE